MFLEVLAYGPHADGGSANRVGRWVADAFGLGECARVGVAEVRCADPACPFVHTVVAIRDGGAGPPRQFWLHVPLDVVSREDVIALTRFSGTACGPTGRTPHPPPCRPARGA